MFRDGKGQIVTKHNLEANAERNRQRVQAMHINTYASTASHSRVTDLHWCRGDMEGGHDIHLPNRVFNSLKTFEVKHNAARFRIHDKDESVAC